MHTDVRMQKVLQSTIYSAEFIGIPTNNKFDKAVQYIYDNNSWERCYVILKNIFSCLRVLCLANIIYAGM